MGDNTHHRRARIGTETRNISVDLCNQWEYVDIDCPPKLLPFYAAHTQVFFSLKINFRPFFFVYMRAAPSRRVAMLYLRTPPALRAFPRSYCHPTQPICKQISPKSKLFAHLFANVHIFLYLCALIWNGVLHSQQIRIPLN